MFAKSTSFAWSSWVFSGRHVLIVVLNVIADLRHFGGYQITNGMHRVEIWAIQMTTENLQLRICE